MGPGVPFENGNRAPAQSKHPAEKRDQFQIGFIIDRRRGDSDFEDAAGKAFDFILSRRGTDFHREPGLISGHRASILLAPAER